MIQIDKDIIDVQQRFQKEYNLKKVLELLNNPQNNLPTISVVGTNGKGSSSFYLSKGLLKKYKKVGLFTSPAFIYHNERIQINNEYISDSDLLLYIKLTKQYVKPHNLTFFEIWTLIAILYFADKCVDVVVMEAGIGGLKDSTYLMNNRLATLVTSISFDHTEILGNTIEEIIYQKVNIAKPNTKIFISNDNLIYKDIFENQTINQNEIIWGEILNDQIQYQQANKGLVKTVLKSFEIDDDQIFTLNPPLGRFTQLEYKNNKIILDGAHNVDGIHQLVNSVNNKNIKVIYGSIESKDYNQILEILKSNFENVYITNFDYFKSWNIDNINHKNKIYNLEDFIIKNNDDLLICGSLYFVPLAYQLINKLKSKEA